MDPIDEQRYFETINGREIRCCCSTTDNSVEILIENLAFVAERQRNIQQIVGILLVCILLNAAIGHQHAILIAVNVAFFVVIAIKCHVLANFVEFEKLHVVDGFSLEYTTKYCFSKRHKYLSIDCIHDIIINEVIFGFRTIYILQVLMKGIQFKDQPIVPLLSELNPRIACLQLVYNLLRKQISSIR